MKLLLDIEVLLCFFRGSADFVVTRDEKHVRGSPLPPRSPGEVLALMWVRFAVPGEGTRSTDNPVPRRIFWMGRQPLTILMEPLRRTLVHTGAGWRSDQAEPAPGFARHADLSNAR